MLLSGDRGDQGQPEINAGRDAAAGHAIAIEHHPLSDRNGAEALKITMARPMGRRAIALEQACRAKHQRAGADARHPCCIRSRAAQPGERRFILHRVGHAEAARHAKDIGPHSRLERGTGQQWEASVGRHRIQRFCDQLQSCIRQARQDLRGAGQVKLCHLGEEEERDLHRSFTPFASSEAGKRMCNPAAFLDRAQGRVV